MRTSLFHRVVGSIMNLISGIHHSCKKREYTIICIMVLLNNHSWKCAVTLVVKACMFPKKPLQTKKRKKVQLLPWLCGMRLTFSALDGALSWHVSILGHVSCPWFPPVHWTLEEIQTQLCEVSNGEWWTIKLVGFTTGFAFIFNKSAHDTSHNYDSSYTFLCRPRLFLPIFI